MLDVDGAGGDGEKAAERELAHGDGHGE